MAVTSYIYNAFKLKQFNGNALDLDTDTIKCALFTSSYTPALTDTLYSGITGEVANGNGYTTGGATLTNPTFSGTTTVKFTADAISWSSASFTARYAVLYGSSSSKLIGYIDFGTDETVSDGTLTITPHANGLLSVTSS